MADNKTKPTQLSVAKFVAALTDSGQRADASTLVKLLAKTSGEKPRMWGTAIIGFGNHHYVYESGREGDMPLVAFSPRKAATVLYGLGAASGTLRSRLGKHSAGKGCLYIKKLADVDLKVLEKMVEQAVRRRKTPAG